MTRTEDALLFKLLLLRLRGGVRQRLQEFKTRRGLLFLLVTLAVIALLILQPAGSENPLASLFSRDKEQLRRQIGQFMPTGLLAAYLLTVFISPSPGVYFSPSEINLLFSAPFTRRALLLYKLGSYAFGVLLSSLLIMLLVPTSAYSPPATLFGAFLTLMFIQLLTVVTTLLVQVSKGYIGVRRRSSYLPAVMLISLAAATVWSTVDGAAGMSASLTQFQSSRIGSLISAPFTVFSRIFLAPSFFPDVLAWATLGLMMNGGLIALVIRLDRHVSEASTAASLKFHTRWDRARRGGLPWGPQFSTVRSFMPPPVLGGIGPLAWRQMLSAFRNSRKVIVALLGMAILAGPLLGVASAEISIWSLIGAVFVAAIFVLPRLLVFDFRSDLDAMENLKALPLPAWKICLGQLVTPVLLTSLIELLLLGSAALGIDSQSSVFLLGISLFLVPFNLLLYGLENLFFLLFPAPLVPVGRADFDFIGRTLVGYAVTASVLIASCALSLGAGFLTVKATGLQWPAFLTVVWLSLAFIAVMLMPLLSCVFKRFDVK